jgi:hypothetical protein
MTLSTPDETSSPWPTGPAVLYISDGAVPTATVVDRADFTHMTQRDRALCRALLEHALQGLDDLEAVVTSVVRKEIQS